LVVPAGGGHLSGKKRGVCKGLPDRGGCKNARAEEKTSSAMVSKNKTPVFMPSILDQSQITKLQETAEGMKGKDKDMVATPWIRKSTSLTELVNELRGTKAIKRKGGDMSLLFRRGFLVRDTTWGFCGRGTGIFGGIAHKP